MVRRGGTEGLGVDLFELRHFRTLFQREEDAAVVVE